MADPVFSLTIDDTSPLVLYSPFADTFSQPQTGQGWNPYYTASGFASIDSGAGSPISPAIGNGTSLHLTAADGAALQIIWNGTDITLFGTLILPISSDLPDGTYSINLDGTATTNFLSSITASSTVLNADTDFLVSFKGLQDGPHTLQLTFHNPDGTANAGNSTSGPLLAFDRAVAEVGAGMPNATPTPSSSLTSTAASPPTPSTTAVTVPVPDNETAFRGQWDFVTNLLPGSGTTFHTSTNVGDRATLIFNGSAVGLTGLTTPNSGGFNVSLDSGDPVNVSGRASFTSSEPTLLFFRTGLDPSVMHAIEVINAGPTGAGDGAGSLLVLGAANVTTIQPAAATPAGASNGSRLPRGTVAAIAIGVTLAVAVIAAALFFFIRRRRRSSSRKRQMLVNPEISRARSLAFLFPHKRHADHDQQKGLEAGFGENAVLDIRSATPEEKADDSDESEAGEGESNEGRRLSAAEKGKQRATQRSNNTSKNSDGSYSIELPDLTIAQVPRGYLPASAVPSTPSPPRTLIPSPTSPRSPARPRGPRDLPGREAVTRGILLSGLPPPPEVQVTDEGELTVPTPAYLLPEARISPLRVEFASDVQSRPEGRTERTISTGAISLPQSLKQALAQQQQPQAVATQPSEPPSPTRTSRLYSFLDFSSTPSSQSASNSTGKSRSSSRSKRGSEQSQTVNWATLPPDRRISLGLSMTVGPATASRPSLSPNVFLHPVPLSQSAPALPASVDRPLPSPDTPAIEGPDQDFPYDTNQLPSPTDSIPYTVSDIHFRHSTHSSVSMPVESRRTSAFRWSGSHRPPHPPLPSAGPASPTRPSHRRGGSQSGSQTMPPFIVQRLLGRATGSNPASPLFSSPITPQFASMQGMTAAAHATASRSSTPPRGSTSGPSSPTVQVPGSPSQAAPGSSTTTVFGFQLGRRGERS
ncbi:hypothetical protein LXA43DRAFT_970492 [Ganoderma leucocontextum]|nr:hypothetical protein LXA43DRAFT_970492 [Ganoderma leucocontextum]